MKGRKREFVFYGEKGREQVKEIMEDYSGFCEPIKLTGLFHTDAAKRGAKVIDGVFVYKEWKTWDGEMVTTLILRIPSIFMEELTNKYYLGRVSANLYEAPGV